MSRKHARISVVEDVVIPAHLLAATTQVNGPWTTQGDEPSLSEPGPVQQAIRTEALERQYGRLRRSASVNSSQPEKPRDYHLRRQSTPLSVAEISTIAEPHDYYNKEFHQIQWQCSPGRDFGQTNPRAQNEKPFPTVSVNGELPVGESAPTTRGDAWPLPPRPHSYRISRIEPTEEPPQRTNRHSIYDVYEKAKERRVALQRKYWVQVLFEYTVYIFLLAFIYFVLIGMPLWRGAVWWLYYVVRTKFVIPGGWGITIGIAIL